MASPAHLRDTGYPPVQLVTRGAAHDEAEFADDVVVRHPLEDEGGASVVAAGQAFVAGRGQAGPLRREPDSGKSVG